MLFAQCLIALVSLATIESAALSVDSVVSVRWFQAGNTVVVAALTKPLYTRSAIRETKEKIACAVRRACSGERVLVTFDLDLYAKIKSEISDRAKTEIIKQLESRELT